MLSFSHTITILCPFPGDELRRRIAAVPLHPVSKKQVYEPGVIVSETATGFKIATERPGRGSALGGYAAYADRQLLIRFIEKNSGPYLVFLLFFLLGALVSFLMGRISQGLTVLAGLLLTHTISYLSFRLTCRKLCRWLKSGLLTK